MPTTAAQKGVREKTPISGRQQPAQQKPAPNARGRQQQQQQQQVQRPPGSQDPLGDSFPLVAPTASAGQRRSRTDRGGTPNPGLSASLRRSPFVPVPSPLGGRQAHGQPVGSGKTGAGPEKADSYATKPTSNPTIVDRPWAGGGEQDLGFLVEEGEDAEVLSPGAHFRLMDHSGVLDQASFLEQQLQKLDQTLQSVTRAHEARSASPEGR